MSKNIFSVAALVLLFSAALFAIESINKIETSTDDPPAILQGGETFETAYVIPSLPFIDSGTTVGYQHDYIHDCYPLNTNGPDVVYSYIPSDFEWVSISLCNSQYDASVNIYEPGNIYPIRCSDGGCAENTLNPRILQALLVSGNLYYIVVSGNNNESGPYQLDVILDHVSICQAMPGDSNGDRFFNGLDVVFSVNHLKGGDIPPPVICNCPNPLFAGADANGSCTYNGLDVTYAVNYLGGGSLRPYRCPTCP